MEKSRNKLIGERVRFYRTTRKMSLSAFTDLLPTKMTGQQLARYETGTSRWPADLLIDVALLIGVDIRLLTGLEDGKHEGKETDEWEAERYKMLLLKLRDPVRKRAYQIIDIIEKL